MASAQSDAEDVVLRYLTGQLTPAERDAFERAVTERPELREQTELVLKLKEGLARLHERGELDALLRAPRRPSWLPYAAAAAVAIISLIAWAWFYLRVAPSNPLALSPQQFVSAQQPPARVVGSYVLARTRGSSATTELPRTGVIELRVLPSVLSSAVRYHAEVIASNRGASRRIVGQLDAGLAAADGYVTLYFDSAKLASGDYELLLSPSIRVGPDSKADRFAIRVR